MNKPNFFILGGPKCGTTSMYHWLKQHSQVFFPEIKETHFFATDLNDHKRAVKKKEDYLSLYKNATEQQLILGDASVFYLYSNNAVKNILEFNSNAKFLVMLRNPVEMVVSLHAQYLHTGNEIYEDFKKAWKLNEQRIKGVGITRITEDPQLLHYGEVCSLGKQIKRLLYLVEREKVKFIFLENLKEKPDKSLKDLFHFLEIRDESIEKQAYNVATKRKYPKVYRAIKHINRFVKDLGFGKFNTGFGKFMSRINSTKSEKYQLTNEFKKEIEKYFQKDIELLKNTLNQKVPF